MHAVAAAANVDAAHALIDPLDFTDRVAVGSAEQRIFAAWDGRDLALIVAGTHQEIRARELTAASANALLKINLNGPIATVATVASALIAQGGAVGIVSSYRALPKALVYGASKAALINFAQVLYVDLHPKGSATTLSIPAS
jgi:NADP-dependent 3-hydroxy acid dehydrogenase YdfG